MFICFFSELGVFAKRPIYKFTQFGPFVGELVSNETLLTNSSIPIMVSNFVSYCRKKIRIECLQYSGDKNISILHWSCRMSDLQLSLVLQTHIHVL